MYNTGLEDTLYPTIEDFRTDDAAALKDDSPFRKWIAETFDVAWKTHKASVLPEIEYNVEKYNNSKAEDYYLQEDGSSAGDKHLFSGAMISEKTRRIVSFLVKENPRPDIDPIFTEGYEQRIAKDFYNWPEWVQAGIAKHGGAQPQQMQDGQEILVLTNPEGFKEWYHGILDEQFNYWWTSGNMNTFRYLMAKWAVLCPEAYGMLRLVDDPTTNAMKIVAEHIKSQNVIKDPTATTVEDRRIFFHAKKCLMREAEMEYGLKKGALKPDSEQSELFEGLALGAETEPEEKHYKHPRVLVVQAFCKDTRKITIGDEFESEEIPAYPSGRIITFIPNQEDMYGIKIVRDEPNTFSDFQIQHLILDPEDELHGRALVRDIIRISNLCDEVMQQGIANLRALGNGRLLYDVDALVDPENITNAIGEKIPVNGLQGVQFMYPPSGVGAESQSMHAYLESISRSITGVEEVGEGKRPNDVMSGRALQLLTSQISQLMQIIVNMYAEFLTRFANVWFSMLGYAYPEGKRILVGDIDGKREWRTLPFAIDEFVDGGEVHIKPETIIPKDELSKKNMLLAMAELTASDGAPLIPPEYLLSALDIENAEEIKAAIEKRNILMQQLQQMEQALQQSQQQGQQAMQQVEKLSRENEGMTKKLVTKEIDGRITLMEQQMKDQGMNFRQDLQGQYAAMTQKLKGEYDLLKEQLKQASNGSGSKADG